MVIYLAKTHQVVTIDGRETCPSACTPTMFIDPKTGKPLGFYYASDQPLATGVPGDGGDLGQGGAAVRPPEPGRGPAAGHRRGERGFRVDADFRQLEQSDLPELRSFTASRKLFLTPAGQPAAGRAPAAQPRPGQDLPAAGPPRPGLPVRRAAGPGHRPGR